MLLNRYPWWKNVLVIVIMLLGFIYASPILFPDTPAIQILGMDMTVPITDDTANTVKQVLQTAALPSQSIEKQDKSLLVRFPSTDVQLKARDIIQAGLGNNYLVALNLAPSTPGWLKALNAKPMKLGLDLRGGVHFLMQVDVDSVIKQRVEGDLNDIGQVLRTEHIRYAGVARNGAEAIAIEFRTKDNLDDAYSLLSRRFGEFVWVKNLDRSPLSISGTLSPQALQQAKQDIMEQTMNTLRHRVNELGVSEAIVQQQGATRVVVDLPGIQDTAQAKKILGKTATLELHMVDSEHDPRLAVGGVVPPDTKLYVDEDKQPLLLQNQIILRGSSITYASSGFDDRTGRPAVSVRLGGGGEALFTKTTAENIGKRMAILYVEVKPDTKMVNGQKVITYNTERRVISAPTIQEALGNSFQITGLSNPDEARTLALLLRAGALPATVAYLEERQVGPSLGKQNIHMGVLSVEVGALLVVIFMALYYGVMGLIADIALLMNLVLIIAILSWLGATLTLPGIAGMVLTVGMAVDANVLIFERIREELRNGIGLQSSIHAGYERAFVTIVDANLTTLIVAMVLFGLGSGTVKAFAVTLTVGLMTSMFTAITGTRAIVNYLYGNRPIKKISIGI